MWYNDEPLKMAQAFSQTYFIAKIQTTNVPCLFNIFLIIFFPISQISEEVYVCLQRNRILALGC